MTYPYLSGVNYESVVDGPGVRVALFLSGCTHKCKGCHNPETHDPCYGQEITSDTIDGIVQYIQNNPYITGITLTGGDPMYDPEKTANLLYSLYNRLGDRWKQLNVWMYTGYKWKQLMDHYQEHNDVGRILTLTDVVVDGRYFEHFADPRLAFRGSYNQRMINVRQSMKLGIPCLWNAVH